MKSIAIIGAGPAGLVTAKTFLRSQSNLFKVTILEKSNRIGGLWAVEKNNHGILDYGMSTNLSKFTVAFSDLSWESLDWSNASSDSTRTESFLPIFPKAWHVEKYLQKYVELYIPKDVFKFNSLVTNAEPVQHQGEPKWKLEWKDLSPGSLQQDNPVQDIFDHVIVASGFFAAPRNLELDSCLEDVPIIHSSQFRTLSDLTRAPAQNGNGNGNGNGIHGNILVVGGGMSGAEAAARLAFETSSRRHSSNSVPQETNIIHVISRPFYPIPPMIPISSPNSHKHVFLPLDLCFYNLLRSSSNQERSDVEKIQATHVYLKSIGASNIDANTEQPAFVAITEDYEGFVQSGDIICEKGRLVRLIPGSKGNVTAVLDGVEKRIENVVGIINATGFSPLPALSFLSKVKEVLYFDEKCLRLPILLGDYYTSSEKLDNLGFVGFYEGPFWGVMEMQARLLLKRWTNREKPNSNLSKLKQLRMAMLQKSKSLPQYWMGDYMGIMESIAKELKIEKAPFDNIIDPIIPARYGDSQANTLENLQQTISHAVNGKFVGRALFRALHGKWNMKRQLESFIPNFPSGTFTGIANFFPRHSTESTFEYLYTEQGILVTKQGFEINANRRYVYRYNEESDKVSIWFVKDDGITVDYLYHNIQIDTGSTHGNSYLAKADHLCIEDMYNTAYDFHFNGVALEKFEIQHAVKGPRKDYISSTWYTP